MSARDKNNNILDNLSTDNALISGSEFQILSSPKFLSPHFEGEHTA